MFMLYARLVKAWKVPAQKVTTTVCVLSLATLPIWGWAMRSGLWQATATSIAWQALYHGVGVGIIATLLFAYCVEMIGPVLAAMFIPLMPLATAVIAIFSLGEFPQVMEWAGMVVVLAGMAAAFAGPALSVRLGKDT
jgi:drug/metabolite transporter (DMT)-like permease